VRDESGAVYRLVGVSEDITELRQVEERFLQAQKMEAVGSLAGGVAHDFNNLITVILSYSEMLLSELPANDPLRADAEEIRKAGERASELTRQLLTFSRRQVIQPKVVRINELIEATGNMLERLIAENIALAMALDPEAGAVRVDAGQMEQVIVNLAVNARDAMPDGGRLLIESKNIDFPEPGEPDQESPLYPSGRNVMLAVSDTGIGMDAETQKRIFEPFYTTKEPGKGTGLGLSTVYGIVRQSGGQISVYSEPGKGTSFKVYLPRVDDVPETREEIAAQAKSAAGRETVLIVDDDPAVLSIARYALDRLGYHVISMDDGESALAYLTKQNPPIDLLVTDLNMPRMSGRILADRFAAIHPYARILFVSGYTDDAVVRHDMLESGAHYLAKPFTPDSLARKVREVLDEVKPRESR
jgi:nitrogen-specific signal transduction histidine kinase/CheY-like chemotaxis protein